MYGLYMAVQAWPRSANPHARLNSHFPFTPDLGGRWSRPRAFRGRFDSPGSG